MQETITISSLDAFSATVQRQKTAEIDGVLYEIGQRHSKAYVNDDYGRKDLMASEPESVVSAVMSIWGDSPTINENKRSEQRWQNTL